MISRDLPRLARGHRISVSAPNVLRFAYRINRYENRSSSSWIFLFFFFFFPHLKRHQPKSLYYNVDCDQEVDTYRTMAGHQFNEGKLDVKANILMWWKVHAVRFPYLSRLARRYLAMSATSASVERLFSVSGQVVTSKRASLVLSA